jgi:hypothetical protein
VLGDGDSPVARNMQLRRPPSLLEARIRAQPPGRIFETITHGFGLMPAHEALLALDERWAVVAYVGALQLAQGVAVDELPASLRARLEQEAPR